MSQDESKIANHEETDDVEAHGHRKFNANEEAPAEGESDDDFEAHVHRSNVPKKQ
jgi:hypothetical protein